MDIRTLPPTSAPRPAKLAKAILTDEDTYATTMLVLALDQLGPEVLQWHPLTVRTELERRNGVKLPKGNFDRLMAAVTVVTTDLFFKDVARFVQLANILSGDDFQPDEFDPADAYECAWAITEALLLSPPDEGEEEVFAPDVCRYVGHVLKEEGFVQPPDVLRIAVGADFSGNVEQFRDDPALFAGIFQVQQGKTAEVESLLRDGLAELIAQLEALPLTQGDARNLAARVKLTR